MTTVTKKWAPPTDQEIILQAQKCFAEGSQYTAEDAEYMAMRIKDPMIQALAISIIHYPLLSPQAKYMTLDQLAFDGSRVNKEHFRSENYPCEEELRMIFRRLGAFIDCYKRSDQLTQIENALKERLEKEDPIQITLDYLNDSKEYFLQFYLPLRVNSRWLAPSFQRKFELVGANFRTGIRVPREYSLYWPNIDEELALVSGTKNSALWRDEVDFSQQRMRLKIQNSESVLKEFTRCTYTETARVLCRLSETRNSTRTLVCGRTFTEAAKGSVHWLMKVDSPTVSCLAFRSTDQGYDSEVLMRVHGFWLSRQAQTTPPAQDEADKVKKKQTWPWNHTFDLGAGQKVDLTETAPCFVDDGRTFAVREIADDAERNRAHLLNYGIRMPADTGPQVWEFTTLSPTLWHPDETEAIGPEIASLAGLPLGVAKLIAWYADHQGMTIPRQLLSAPQQS